MDLDSCIVTSELEIGLKFCRTVGTNADILAVKQSRWFGFMGEYVCTWLFFHNWKAKAFDPNTNKQKSPAKAAAGSRWSLGHTVREG